MFYCIRAFSFYTFQTCDNVSRLNGNPTGKQYMKHVTQFLLCKYIDVSLFCIDQESIRFHKVNTNLHN